jgi:putative FmdB family regulatory protein
MPIYEYRCAKCSNEFERFFSSHKKMTESKVACPDCASKRVKRLISAPRVKAGDGASDFEMDTSSEPGANGLLGRKEINEITKRRKKAGLE